MDIRRAGSLAVAAVAFAAFSGVAEASQPTSESASVTRLGSTTQSHAAEPNRDLEFERIQTAGAGGYIVQVEDGESAAEVLADRQRVAAHEVEDLSGEAFNGAVADLDAVQAEQLRDDPRVVSVERDKVITVNVTDEREPLEGSQWATTSEERTSVTALTTAWGLDRTDQRNLPLDSDYSPPADGSGTHIYIVDSGVDLYHPDFGGRVGDSAYVVGGTALDCHGHGTHVAGTAASSTYGMAKGATVHSVRVLECDGTGLLSSVIAGYNWIAENAEPHSVVNLSLGGAYSAAENAAVAGLVDSGIPVVAAAGNEAVDACSTSPASTGPAITVGAVDSTDSHASFSNFGPCLDVYAPGVGIKSLLMNEPGSTSTKSGTSMAAPHVAGALAVLWSQDLALSGNQIDDHLVDQATPGVVLFPFGQGGSPNLNLYVEPAHTTPGVPTGVSAVPGDGAVMVSWTAPSSDGGSAVTGYTAMSSPGGETCTTTVTSCEVTGLVNGTTYTFTVTASNPVGSSTASDPSDPVTPTAPAPPAPVPPAPLPTAPVTSTTPAPPAPAPPAPVPPALIPPAPAAPVVAVKVKAKDRRSKLYVNVNPNKGKGFWKFKVQRQRASGTWRIFEKTYKTRGKGETRKLNFRKGTYRVKVKAKYGYMGTTSASVSLRK